MSLFSYFSSKKEVPPVMSTVRIISQRGTLLVKIDDSKCLKIEPGIENELFNLDISEISVEFNHNSKTRQMLLEALKVWKPVCEVFSVEKAVDMLYISKLIRTVKVTQKMELTTTNQSFQTTTLADFKMESGELRLKVDGKCQGEGLFAKMKELSFVDIETDPQSAIKVFRDLQSSTETPKLNRLTMKVSSRIRLKDFPYMECRDIHFKPLTKKSSSTFLLRLQSQKIAVIAEYLMNPHTRGLAVNFIDGNTAEQLEGLISLLGMGNYITEKEKSRFLKGNEDEQLKVIQEAYTRTIDKLSDLIDFDIKISIL